MSEKFKAFFMQYSGYLVVAFTSVIYILTAFLQIDETGKSVARIIADGAVSFLLGTFFNEMLGLQGMMSGDRDDRVRQAIDDHGETVIRISPYIDRLDEWCESENKENYKRQRARILARGGFAYSDCFDADGVAIPLKPNVERLKNPLTRREEKHRIRIYKKAVRLKLTELKPGDLTGEGGKNSDPFFFGRTKGQFESQQTARDIIVKVLTAGIFGYYGVRLITDFNAANLIWMTLQVSIFLVMGMIRLYKSYNFVTGEYRHRIVKKTDELCKFENSVRKGEDNGNEQKQ
ncbi:MAG: hypothetical protein IJX38_01295 [Clostridia bacterium]|nr:hypothetical protein [Clostridia bacterium]